MKKSSKTKSYLLELIGFWPKFSWSISLCKITQLKKSEMRPNGWTLSYEPLQTSTPTLVSQRSTNCCSLVCKLFWINFGTQLKLRHTALRISKKIVCNLISSVRQLLVPKNYNMLAFLTEVKWVSLTLPWCKMVSKRWRYVFECWGLWLFDSSDKIMIKN